MRFKNFGSDAIVVPIKVWGLPAMQGPQLEGVETFTVRQSFGLSVEGPLSMTDEELAVVARVQEAREAEQILPDQYISIQRIMEPGYITEDFDPEDPIVQIMLKAHPELKPFVVPSVWERLVNREPER